MGIFLKGEHMLADVSAMTSSELRRHCNHYFIFKSYLRDVFPQLPVHPSTEYTRTDTLHSDPICFFTEHVINHNHKPTATPPSTVIAATDNHSLPPFASLARVPPPPPPLREAVGPYDEEA